MKKAVEKVNKHILNGRPLKVKEVAHTSQFSQIDNFTLYLGHLADSLQSLGEL